MDLLYVPLMAAKRGEFTALSKLKSTVAQRLIPLFDLPAKAVDAVSIEKPINRTAKNAGKAWGGRSAFLDITKWSPHSKTETGIHVLEYAFGQFKSNGVEVNPVIGYDRWGDPAYMLALKNIVLSHAVTPCVRFDRESMQDDMLDPDYFSDRVREVMEFLGITPQNCYVLIDFGDVSRVSVPEVIGDAEAAIAILRENGFGTVIVAGSSMPTTVTTAVDSPDAEGCIPRIEMMAWKAIFSASGDSQIVFGDYLIRSSDSVEGRAVKHANAKLRYTIENQCFIVRGHSKMYDSLNDQHKELAGKLVISPHYMGASFSWGDSEVLNCSLGLVEIKDFTGMIAVDSNHHINAVVVELFEHQGLHAPAAIAAKP